MRPYRLPCGTHIDLDHVLAIQEPYYAAGTATLQITLAFRDKPLVLSDSGYCGRYLPPPVPKNELAGAMKRAVFDDLYAAWTGGPPA